ncbi:hypothetical protein GS597_08995 [Synechococcales cyanobacterium C]|uniref:Uncharacterized protein n=1 Tax=Petrachloros mirabilis ULC683 TaxID=2781853 RepID=A0A8K1ZZ50_9CYAN|nr:hypothetical protein [Petrachloros mirabilis]NCJ06638.1 hypothetical protein [Petrachloros mirabilis ULC683]
MHITTQQLIGLGATQYQARELIKACPKVGKQGRSNTYSRSDILAAIDQRLANPRIRPSTRITLTQLQQQLLALGSNIIPIPFGAPATPTKSAVQSLLNTGLSPSNGKHKLKAAEIRAKHAAK